MGYSPEAPAAPGTATPVPTIKPLTFSRISFSQEGPVAVMLVKMNRTPVTTVPIGNAGMVKVLWRTGVVPSLWKGAPGKGSTDVNGSVDKSQAVAVRPWPPGTVPP
ncbi:MAG: hypothetical protein IPI00_12775 [Flavobacteriales bacterium]|nr:hypothetical protein [Flavobacteriales bacterium]